MRLIFLAVLVLSPCACGSSTSEPSGVSSDHAGADGGSDGDDGAGDVRSGEASVGVATSCADAREGEDCSGSFSCERGSVSCCVGGEIKTLPLFACQCRDGTFSCYPTDDCWGVPYACVDAAPPDGGADSD